MGCAVCRALGLLLGFEEIGAAQGRGGVIVTGFLFVRRSALVRDAAVQTTQEEYLVNPT
jgi:hypothetical protein